MVSGGDKGRERQTVIKKERNEEVERDRAIKRGGQQEIRQNVRVKEEKGQDRTGTLIVTGYAQMTKPTAARQKCVRVCENARMCENLAKFKQKSFLLS